jgi:hypothetical protein
MAVKGGQDGILELDWSLNQGTVNSYISISLSWWHSSPFPLAEGDKLPLACGGPT